MPPAAHPRPRTATVAPLVARQTLGRGRGDGSPTRDRREDPQLAADRRALRALGVPAAWTAAAAPRRPLHRRPAHARPDAGGRHRPGHPRRRRRRPRARRSSSRPTAPPSTCPPSRRHAVPRRRPCPAARRRARLRPHRGPVHSATSSSPSRRTAPAHGAAAAVEALQAVGAGAVLAIVAAADRGRARRRPCSTRSARSTRSPSRAPARTDQPAAMLQLGLPVVRLDGIPVDRYTWTRGALRAARPVTVAGEARCALGVAARGRRRGAAAVGARPGGAARRRRRARRWAAVAAVCCARRRPRLAPLVRGYAAAGPSKRRREAVVGPRRAEAHRRVSARRPGGLITRRAARGALVAVLTAGYGEAASGSGRCPRARSTSRSTGGADVPPHRHREPG